MKNVNSFDIKGSYSIEYLILTYCLHNKYRWSVLVVVDWGGAEEAEESGTVLKDVAGNQPAPFIIPGDLIAF